MKKIMLFAAIVAAVGLFTSCAEKTEAKTYHELPEQTTCQVSYAKPIVRENLFSDEVERAIDVVYASSCEYLTHLYGEEVNYDPVATDEMKLFIIRKADLEDEDGDVIPEVPEYDEIYDLLWPAGYPKE